MDYERYTADILDSITAGVMVVETTSRVAYANLEAGRILKCDREALVGSYLLESPGLGELMSLVSHVRGAQPIRTRSHRQYEVLINDMDGRKVPLGVSLNALSTSDERVEGYVIICKDLSESKVLREKVEQSRKLSALGTMATGVAHNFNNILGAILGRVQILQRLDDLTKVRAGLKIIERAALDGTSTVHRIRDFARKKDLRRAFDSVDLAEVLEDVLAFTRTRWHNEALGRGVVYEVRKDFRPVPPVIGAASELREVFINLLLNALDAMPGGGVLSFGLSHKNHQVKVTVRDTGLGMSDEVQRRIFDPFFTTKGLVGTGMGLSESYGIIVRHQGQITCHSRRGEGSTFTVVLPAAETSRDEDLPRGSLLLVDADPARRELLEDLCLSLRVTVEAASTGEEARARLGEQPQDILVLEALALGEDLDEFLHWIEVAVPEASVLITTDDRNREFERVDEVLVRPFPPDKLLATLKAMLERKE